MLHKNVIEKKAGFRTLDAAEVGIVSGGLGGFNEDEGPEIIVTGKRPDPWVQSIYRDDLLAVGMDFGDLFGGSSPNLFGDGSSGDGGGGGFGKTVIDAIIEFIVEQLGETIMDQFEGEPTISEREDALASGFDPRDIVGEADIHGGDGTAQGWVMRDGTVYFDSNGNGRPDSAAYQAADGSIFVDRGDGRGFVGPSND